MGYDVTRFVDLPSFLEDELTCVICCYIFSQPVVTPCGHTFCKGCVTEWFFRDKSCPVCRKYVVKICRPPTIINNLLGRLRIHCRYFKKGCSEIVSIDGLRNHEEKCKFAPKPNLFRQLMKSFVPDKITSAIMCANTPRIQEFDGDDANDEDDNIIDVRNEDVLHVSLQTVAIIGILYNCYNGVRGILSF